MNLEEKIFLGREEYRPGPRVATEKTPEQHQKELVIERITKALVYYEDGGVSRNIATAIQLLPESSHLNPAVVAGAIYLMGFISQYNLVKSPNIDPSFIFAISLEDSRQEQERTNRIKIVLDKLTPPNLDPDSRDEMIISLKVDLLRYIELFRANNILQ
jgi:hypothetical protein